MVEPSPRAPTILLCLSMIGAASTALRAEPGYVHVTGNVIFTSSSNLIMEFAGPTRGTEYDAMDVDGVIVLRGSLSLERLGGYQPGPLVPHHIIHAGSRDGVFRSVSGMAVSPVLSLAVTYTGADVFVTSTLPGDSDVDGDVDFDDLLVLAQNYTDTNSEIWQSGDFTGNAAVTFDDLLLLAQNYSTSLLDGPIASGDMNTLSANILVDFALARSLVPEPVISLLLGTVMIFVRRGRDLR